MANSTSNQRLRALGRLKTGEKNKTEQAYEDFVLRPALIAGDVLWYAFEGVKLRLADNTFYTPDFAVMASSGQLECHEIKGHWQDDARVKIKVAAAAFPMVFKAIQGKPVAKRNGGGWTWAIEEF